MKRIFQQLVRKHVKHRRGQITQCQVLLHQMQEEIKQLQQKLERMEKPLPIRGSDTIDRAWHSHPKAKEVFAGYHLHACHKCSVRFDETIQEAAAAYDFSEEAMLVELNRLQREKS